MYKKLLILTSFVLVFGLVSSAIAQPTGEILFEYWYNIGGGTVADLTGQAAYPDNPDDGELRTALEGKVDWGDNYGAKASGYLYPPEDGDYTFWISGDDGCALFLSTDDDPANATMISEVPGWTSYLQWDSYAEQQSAPITLAAGGKYYIEALLKEAGGGDSLTAGWIGPGIGEEITVIDGAYLSPADPTLAVQKAKSPLPADGAVDVDTVTLEWASGMKAVSHVVYLDGELLAETENNFAAATLAPGTTYTWQVDEVQEDGTVIEGNVWSFTTLPLEAHFPSPADGEENVASPLTLSWTPGKNTIINDVYFGTDEALVAARDASTFKGKLMDASFDAGELELFSTYYWAVDEFTPPPTGLVAGPVWSFSTEKFVLIADEVTVNYDNSAEPYVSEAAVDTVADLTAEGQVSDLTLSFQGQASNLSIDEDTGTYMVTGEGADIWGSTDAFHYVYMQLTGDGEISARVVSNGTGSNAWAKGGVMIRETTAHDSRHAIMAMTGGEGGGITFQGRWIPGERSHSFHGDVTQSPPYWVKLVREGNNITASSSADGVEWTPMTDASPDGDITNPQVVEMADPVLIGLFVTSHADGENRTYTIDNVDIQGDVDGVIVSEDIASVSGNTADSIYVALEDLTGAVAMVAHPYSEATQITSPRGWEIPLSAFEGVDVTQAAKLYVGVGDGEPGGAGVVTFSDIMVAEPVPAGPKDVTVPGDIVKSIPDDGDWPGGEYPALAIDNNVNTKFLHFKGDFDPDPNTGGTGIKVTPLDGPSVVTGLALTTANDTPGRDPIAFKLSGSNESIDGPYELIAEGDVVDFAGEAEWPRFTKNATPITFANDTAYAHYELIFTAIRGPVGGSVNSMQIAEIELLEGAGILSWEAAAAAAEPGYLATSVPLGVYDIGAYSGDQTFEFVVNSNPDEEAVSMALIGRHGHGDTTMAIKFDQWNDTGEYGATIFGVVDLYYGVANNPGVDTHLAFVSSEAAGTTELYIDGALAGSVDGAISLSGLVGIGGANRDPEGTGWVDPFDGDILGVAIYDSALSADQIAANADAFFLVEDESAPTIAWVSYHAADDEPHPDAAGVGFTQAPDIEYTDLLKAQGYNVVRVVTSKEPDVEMLNTMDLVIISRTASSGHYSGSGASLWNSVTTPTINLNGYTLRSSRMGFTDGGTMVDTIGDIRLAVTDPAHPIFAGIALTDGVMDNPFAEGAVPLPTDPTIISRGISVNNNTIDDDGTLLATVATADDPAFGGMMIAEYPAGAVMQNSSGSPDDVLGGNRLVFLTGSREPDGVTGGQAAALYDLYPDGTQMFLNAVEYMLP